MNDYPLWLRAAAQMLRENDPTLRGVANTCEGAADVIATLQRELAEARAENDSKRDRITDLLLAAETLGSEVARLQSCERSMRAAIETALERLEEPPTANCSCHISPPCNDCVDHSGAREAFDLLRSSLTTRHEVMNPPASAARGAEARNLNSANVMGLGEVHRASEARPADDVPAPVRIATLQKEIQQIENHCHSYKRVDDGSYEQCIYELGWSAKTKELNALQGSAAPKSGEQG